MLLKERLLKLVELEGLNPNKFYIKTGLANGFLNTVGEKLRRPTIEKIQKAFPYWNLEWILDEKGDIYLDKPYKHIDKLEATMIIEGGIMMVPLVNQYAHAGYMAGYADAEYIETLPKVPWVVDHEYKGKYVSFEVRGDSMDDGLKHSYEQGDILLCREISPDYWKCKLHIRQWDAFVIVHKTEGIVIKQIIDHDVENGIITCHSFNPLYPDFKVDLREVSQLFNVVKQQKNK